MRYLSIDFGTVMTKAAIFDTSSNEVTLVRFNDADDAYGYKNNIEYQMPTAVLYNEEQDTYEVGTKAERSRNYNPDNFHNLFKLQLSENAENIIPWVVVVFKEVICRAQKTINPTQHKDIQFNKIVLTVPSSTIEGDCRWNNMMSAIQSAVQEIEEVDQSVLIPREEMQDISSFIEIIREPEAAGYAVLKDVISTGQYQDGDIFLVYDFGGGTFDPALIEYKYGTLRVIGGWDSSIPRGKNIGGIYIDEKIKEDILQLPSNVVFNEAIEIISKGNYINGHWVLPEGVSKNAWRIANNNLTDLTELARDAKHTLSNQELSEFRKRQHGEWEYELSREDYYEMIDPLIDDTIQCCTVMLEDYGFSWQDLKAIFLIGGSSKIPLVRQSLERTLSIEEATCTIPSLENSYDYIHAVAIGAALYEKLKPTKEQFYKFGMLALANEEWIEAEYQFTLGQSQYGLGLMWYEGLGRKLSYRNAFNYFSSSSEPICVFMQALMLFRGQGVKKDDIAANKLLSTISSLKYGISIALKNRISLLQSAINGNISQANLNVVYSKLFYVNLDYQIGDDLMTLTNDAVDIVSKGIEEVKKVTSQWIIKQFFNIL